MMDGFIPPKGTREIVILSDRDEKAIQSAAKAVEWFGALGLTVRVARPPEDFKDFNAAVIGTLDAALDKAQAAVRAAVEAAEVCFVSPFSEEWGAQIQTFNDCMTAAGALESGDHARVMALLARAAAIGLSSLQADMLVKAVQKTTDIGIKNLRKTLANETEEARLKAWKAGAAERERAAVAQEAARRRKIEEERARLWDFMLADRHEQEAARRRGERLSRTRGGRRRRECTSAISDLCKPHAHRRFGAAAEARGARGGKYLWSRRCSSLFNRVRHPFQAPRRRRSHITAELTPTPSRARSSTSQRPWSSPTGMASKANSLPCCAPSSPKGALSIRSCR